MDNLETNINVENQVVKNQGFFARVAGILISPAETMKSLIDKPRILFPIISMAVATLLFYILRYDLYQDFMRQMLVYSKVPVEQIDASMKMVSIFGLISASLGALLFWSIITLIIVGLVKLLKGKGSVKQYFSITGYAYVISIIYLLLSFIVSFFSNELLLNSSLALLVPGMKGTIFYGFLRGIDLFTVWQYAVTAIGIKQLSELKGIKIYAIISAIYIGYILINLNGLKYM